MVDQGHRGGRGGRGGRGRGHHHHGGGGHAQGNDWHNILIIRMVNVDNQPQLQILLNFVKGGKYAFLGKEKTTETDMLAALNTLKQEIRKRCNSAEIPFIPIENFPLKSAFGWVVVLPNQYNTWQPQGKSTQNEVVTLGGKNYETRNGFLWINLVDLINSAPTICPYGSDCRYQATTCQKTHSGLHLPKSVNDIFNEFASRNRSLADIAGNYFIKKYSQIFSQAGNGLPMMIESFNDNNMVFSQEVKQQQNNTVEVHFFVQNVSHTETYTIFLTLQNFQTHLKVTPDIGTQQFPVAPMGCQRVVFQCTPASIYSCDYLPVIQFKYQSNINALPYSAKFKFIVPITKFLVPSSCSHPELEQFWTDQTLSSLTYPLNFNYNELKSKLSPLNIFNFIDLPSGVFACSGLSSPALFSVVYITTSMECHVKSRDPAVTETLLGLVLGIFNPALAASLFHKIEY